MHSINIEEPEYPVKWEDCIKPLKYDSDYNVNCPKCKKNCVFLSRHYLKSTPKYLMIPINRFTLENWVPKKLNAVIDIPDVMDLKDFVFPGVAQNEQVLEEV